MVDHAVKTANVLSDSKLSQLLLNGPLAAIQRKSPAENGFEADPKDGVSLNCNLPASKGTMQKFNEPVRIVPCGSLTESGRLSSVCQHLLDPRLFNQNTNGAAGALGGPEKAIRGGMKGGRESTISRKCDVAMPNPQSSRRSKEYKLIRRRSRRRSYSWSFLGHRCPAWWPFLP